MTGLRTVNMKKCFSLLQLLSQNNLIQKIIGGILCLN